MDEFHIELIEQSYNCAAEEEFMSARVAASLRSYSLSISEPS